MTIRSLWLLLLIALPIGASAAETQPRALLEKAESVQRLGHRNQALEYLEEARLRAESSGDAALTAAIHGALGKAYLLRGRSEEARTFLSRALESSQRLSNRALEAAVLNDLGNLAATEGKAPEALERFRQSAALSRAADAHAQAA